MGRHALTRLADLIVDRRQLPPEMFRRKHPVPVLLHRPKEAGPDARVFRTGVIDTEAWQGELAEGLQVYQSLEVLPVAKRSGGIFADRVTVGRTRNNDVALPYPNVSKFHAYFTWSPDRSAYYLNDAGSTNGTFVEGSRVMPKQPLVVPDMATVAFGTYSLRFRTTEGLYELLGRLLDEV